MQKHTYAPGIFTLKHFLSAEECRELIDRSEAMGYEEAMVDVGNGQQRMIKGVRNNERVLHKDAAYATFIWEKLRPYAPEGDDNRTACGLNELFRFYKYSPGQRFKMHKDGSFVRNRFEASQYTFMIYLNEGYSGGSTVFKTGEEILPETGTALIFYHPLLHEGTLLTAGTKYVLRSDIMYK
ncbi:2OG-Fe(II) oxygenase [Chitinophaga oryzae]|uniref:2OG-Fe(II) oxygenase n=1 Tax=Chitinophaga oryzae TaxID=2725414 RepID=A0AAE6ZJ75_9BACT|nr:2OG-Fe(II) oxygenase [Chitinophaga oryzae]QJB33172.1 2OG-Fe(II) oxygenase [Chitinophaga oryzae]QJB39648.1 2OG-Fe(II) oxygenase [Chitinophaga oryzae]